jgi:hypothetical protein
MGFLRDLVVRIKGDKTSLDSTLKGAEGSVSKFSGAVKALGGIIAAAFSVGAIISFTKESMKLAAEAEGVKNAFAKLEGSKKLVNDLTTATRGMIDDSDLMALAVKAQNFKIPLKDLSTYLEFATNRAITTGKSVSELTELIVTGLGRKSSRSFIQLGFAAKDVQEAMKSTGGMMSLVKKALADMGPVADTMQVKFDRYATSVKNLKESWGEFVNKSKVINDVISGTAKTFERLGDSGLTAWQKIMMGDKQYREWLQKSQGASAIDFEGYSNDQLAKYVKERETYIHRLNASTKNASLGEKSDIKIEIKKTEEEIALVNKLIAANKTKNVVSAETIVTLAGLEEELKNGEEALKTMSITETDLRVAQQKTNAALREQIAELSKLSQTAKEAAEALDKLKKANEPIYAKYGQTMGGISGVKPTTSGTLAGAPNITPNQGTIDYKAAQIDADNAMTAAELRLEQFNADIRNVLNELNYMVQDFAAQFLDAIGQALAGGNTKDLGKGLLIALANFMVQFGVMLLTTGLGLKAFAESMNNPENAGIAIAAGAALIIAGGAIKGLLSKGAKGGGGSSGGGGYSAAAMEKAMKIEVYGKIEGKDIAITSRRYVEDNG